MIFVLIIAALTQAIQVTNGDTLIGQECWDDYCITLYQSTRPIPWAQAKSNCNGEDSRLLAIPNYDTQKHVKRLIANHSTDRAWIGGRQELGDILQTLYGKPWDPNDVMGLHVSGEDCMTIKKSLGGINYVMDNCDEKNGNQFVICKTNLTEAGCNTTNMEHHWVNGVCYKTLYMVPENERGNNKTDFDWFNAQNMCNNLEDIGGTLLDDLMNSTLQSLLPDNGDVAWTGYMRRRWYWNNPTDVMTYFNWTWPLNTPTTEACATVRQDGMWDPVECSRTQSYYLCINDTRRTRNTGTSTQSITKQQRTTTTRDPTTSNIAHAKTDATSFDPTSPILMTVGTEIPLENGPNIAVYAGAAAGGAVVIVLIVVVVCVLRKKKSEHTESKATTSDAPNSADSTNMTTSSSREQQYEMVPDGFFTPQGPRDDTVAPYAEFGGEPRRASPKSGHGAIYEDAEPVNPSYGSSHRNPEATTGFDPVVDDATRPIGRDTYSTVNKFGESDDMEDVFVDNALYGKY